MDKLCRDCKHLKDGNCINPLNAIPKPDYVNGGTTRGTPIWYGAQFCREDEKACGISALWWEAK